MPEDSASARADQHLKGDNFTLALALADAGIPVFPCRESGPKGIIKAPYTPNGFLDATTDELKIRRWWKKNPGAVPGIPTGRPSGFAVLDLDKKRGKDGVAALEAMGLDPRAVVEVRTPSGGCHLYFRHPEGLRCSADQIAEGVDVRGDAGYVIAPGAVMADGTSYRLHCGNLLRDADRLTAWPAYLVPAVREAGEHEEEREAFGLSLDEAQAMLDALPDAYGDSREEWRAAGMGLHHEFGGSQEAFDLWDDWASQREGYGGYRDQMKQWRSFRADRAGEIVTIRSTMRVARENGWAMDLPAVPDDELPDLLAEFAAMDAEWQRHDERERRTRDLIGDDPRQRRAGPVVLTPDQCAANLNRTPPYLIKNLLLNDTVAVIYGQPNAGKSVIAPYLGYRVAQGKPAFGRRVKQAPVIYASFEGAGGHHAPCRQPSSPIRCRP